MTATEITGLPAGTPDATALLLAAPDDQVIRCREAWRACVAGDWLDAEWWLRHAARDTSDAAWAVGAGRLADWCQARLQA